MDRTEITTAVYDACVELLKVERTDLTEATTFAEDLEADSLDLAEVVMSLEDRFGVDIPEEDLDDVRTIGQAVDVVVRRLDVAA